MELDSPRTWCLPLHEEPQWQRRALICVNRNGVEFGIGTGFSDAQRDHPPKLGSRVTYKYQELTRDGVPRFPVYQRVRPNE